MHRSTLAVACNALRSQVASLLLSLCCILVLLPAALLPCCCVVLQVLAKQLLQRARPIQSCMTCLWTASCCLHSCATSICCRPAVVLACRCWQDSNCRGPGLCNSARPVPRGPATAFPPVQQACTAALLSCCCVVLQVSARQQSQRAWPMQSCMTCPLRASHCLPSCVTSVCCSWMWGC